MRGCARAADCLALRAMASMNLAPLNRKELLDVAKLAEVAERYDDVAYIMKDLWTRFKSERSFDSEERDQFIIGFKNAVTIRRTSWKNLNALLESGQRSAVQRQSILRAYMQVHNEKRRHFVHEFAFDIRVYFVLRLFSVNSSFIGESCRNGSRISNKKSLIHSSVRER